MDSNNKYIASNISYLRNKEKITQLDLAKFLGYSSGSTISNWESGYRVPESIDLLKLSNYFRVPMEMLMSVDLRFNGNVKIITAKEFKEEVLSLLDKAAIDKMKKGYMVQTLNLICEDDEK